MSHDGNEQVVSCTEVAMMGLNFWSCPAIFAADDELFIVSSL